MINEKNKKIIICAFIFFFALMNSIQSSAIFVNKQQPFNLLHQGDILYVGGNGPNNYTRIQDAIDDASPGDTVFVYSGTYYECIIIDKTINLIGEDKNNTIINSIGLENFSINVSYNAHSTYIAGFTIINNESQISAIAIYLLSDNNNISNNILIARDGIIIEENNGEVSCENIISNNYIYCWYEGVIIESSEDNVISGNFISHEDCLAMWLGWSHNNKIINNQLIDNEYGLALYNSNYNFVSGNVIKNSHLGGISCGDRGNIICHNIISNNGEGGLVVNFATHSKIYRNTIENNDIVGLGIYYSGINEIYENNFYDNERDADWQNTYVEWTHVLERNNWYSNYWSRSLAYPKAIRGRIYFGAIGNFPLTLPWFRFDMTPAQEPYDI